MLGRAECNVGDGIISRWSSILAAATESTRRLGNQFGIYRSKRLLLITTELYLHPVCQCLMHADIQVGLKPKNVKINEGFFSSLTSFNAARTHTPTVRQCLKCGVSLTPRIRLNMHQCFYCFPHFVSFFGTGRHLEYKQNASMNKTNSATAHYIESTGNKTI